MMKAISHFNSIFLFPLVLMMTIKNKDCLFLRTFELLGSHYLEQNMGCQVSKTDIQLGKVDPWMYTENGQIKSVDEEYLNKKREVCFYYSLLLLGILEKRKAGK